MDKRYFRLIPANNVDRDRLIYILKSKTFYPESTSTPALPGAYLLGFDYRQFFIFIGFDHDGHPIVFTRQEWTDVEFGTDCIPTADWTTRYGLSIAPTIEALPEYSEIVNGRNYATSIRSFLSYDYQLFNNF